MLLLRTHTASVARPEPVTDDHGWTLPDAAPLIAPVEYPCNLQLDPTTAYVTADDTGGTGPFGPRIVQTGACYFDADADVQAGDVATIDGVAYQVRAVRPMPDPANTGADCLAAAVST